MTAITKTEIRTIDTGCLSVGLDPDSGEYEGNDWSVSENTIILRGSRHAPNPCHEAVIVDAAVSGHQLKISIGIERTSEICQQCIGEIEYEARIGVTDETVIQDVDVTYED